MNNLIYKLNEEASNKSLLNLTLNLLDEKYLVCGYPNHVIRLYN